MGRLVVLSNNQLFVGLDENGLVHDFYYPYVGLDNLTNSRSLQHKIGVYVDGLFSWLDDNDWSRTIDFEETALVSNIVMSNIRLGLEITFEDFVDNEYNAFIRRIRLKNLRSNPREIRLFTHQVFQISHAGRADTVLYVPDDHYILDYKGRCSLLIAGKLANGGDFDQFAVGSYGIEGQSGTYKDAEDGELSNNLVEHGGVDSVLRFSSIVQPNEQMEVDYWIVAADSQSDAQVVHTYLKHYDISARLNNVRLFWSKWLDQIDQTKLASLSQEHRHLVLKSLLVIKAHCDSRGSILASGDSSIFNYGRDYYCYCWPRDGSYAIWPLIRLGIYQEAINFFNFSRDTVHRDGYMMHKYQPDRAIGSTWHPLIHNNAKELAIQEDETCSIVIMLYQYYLATKDTNLIESFFDTFILKAANFLMHYVDSFSGLPHASYDLWEEKFLSHTYTIATVIGALDGASALAKAINRPEEEVTWKNSANNIRGNLKKLFNKDLDYYIKGFLLNNTTLNEDQTLDISSLYGVFMFSGIDLQDPTILATANKIEQQLLNSSPIGGVVRYQHDSYFLSKQQYLGNPWIVSTLWLAQYYIAINNFKKAENLISWSIARAYPSSILGEQFDPETGYNLGVAPLVWSHAELINTILDYYKI